MLKSQTVNTQLRFINHNCERAQPAESNGYDKDIKQHYDETY